MCIDFLYIVSIITRDCVNIVIQQHLISRYKIDLKSIVRPSAHSGGKNWQKVGSGDFEVVYVQHSKYPTQYMAYGTCVKFSQKFKNEINFTFVDSWMFLHYYRRKTLRRRRRRMSRHPKKYARLGDRRYVLWSYQDPWNY